MFLLEGRGAVSGGDVILKRGPRGFVGFHLGSRREGVFGRGPPEQGHGGVHAHAVFAVPRASGPSE